MKKIVIKSLLLMLILATACQKDDITPLKPNLKVKVTDCNGCMGQWDLIDTIP